ncbi:MAG: VCBS domain-containing protein, partial [Mycobacteriaceae bacterium]|nr:VCBS domain-containing protein [Mycobacteriaceae bacterium]
MTAVKPTTPPAPTGTVLKLLTQFLASVGATSLLNNFGPGAPPPGTISGTLAIIRRDVQHALYNKTPTANPVQTSDSLTTGVVTGNLNAADTDGDTLTYTVTKQPANGTVVVNPNGTYTYTPNSKFALTGGKDSFTVTVNDAAGTQLTGTPGQLLNQLHQAAIQAGLAGPDTVSVVVPVTVAPLDKPVAGTPGTPTTNPANGAVTGTLGFTDPGGQPLTYTVTSKPTDGTVTITNGTYTYSPTTLARVQASTSTTPVTDSFSVSASDGINSTASTFSVTVSPLTDVPQTPQTVPASTTQSNGQVTGALGITDPQGLPLTYTVSTQPSTGTVTVGANGSYTYTPTTLGRVQASAPGGATSATFTATATNSVYGTTESVSVPISPLSDTPAAPAASGSQTTSAVNGAVSGTVTATDPQGLPLTYSLTSGPTTAGGGTVTVNANGSYTYTPSTLARVQASASTSPVTDSFTVSASNSVYT